MRTIGREQQRMMNERIGQVLGLPVRILMEHAGLAVAREASDMFARHPGLTTAHVICGHGQNAGDALVAARLLQARGHTVTCFLDDAPPGTTEFAAQLVTIRALGIRCLGLGDFPAQATLIIDGVYGTGFNADRKLPDPVAACMRQVHLAREAGARVLSIDIPSGVDANTAIASEPAIRADRTVTFLYPKTGLVSDPGRNFAGEIVIDRLGLGQDVLDRLLDEIDPFPGSPDWIDLDQVRGLALPRPRDMHKGIAGRSLLIAGSPGFGGAALLAAEAALRSGVGLLNLLTDQSLVPAVLARLPEVMVTGITGDEDTRAVDLLRQLAGKNPTAVAIGPGIGVNVRSATLLASVMEMCDTLVVDADALTLMAEKRNLFVPLLKRRLSRGLRPALLTPHPGEYRRLMPESPMLPRHEAAMRLARDTDSVVVLKGASSVIASPDGKMGINPTGNDGLARGGSGDVLTGLLLGLATQGLSVFDAAVSGVYLHGLAADLAASRTISRTILPTDVIRLLPDAFREAGWVT